MDCEHSETLHRLVVTGDIQRWRCGVCGGSTPPPGRHVDHRIAYAAASLRGDNAIAERKAALRRLYGECARLFLVGAAIGLPIALWLVSR